MRENTKKVVIIAYNFPPVGGAGVQRPVKFVKYLREFGWEPVVLTVANPSVPVLDESLMGDIPNDVAIYKAATFEPSYAHKQTYASSKNKLKAILKQKIKALIMSCMLPDLQILWWPDLIVKLIKIILYEKPDCLFVSAPPFSSFLPVAFIGSVFRVPVIVDFRDEWSFTRKTWENATRNKYAICLDKILEKYSISNCSAFTAANMSYVESIYNAYHSIALGKGFVITNGYDEDDFTPTNPVKYSKTCGGKINFVYTGTVWNATSLKPFILAVKSIMNKFPLFEKMISIKVYGRVVESEKQYLIDNQLTGIVNLLDYCSHDLIINEITQADILIISLADIPGSQKIITGKVFEYMATGNHIFAIVPDGETKQIIVENYNNFTIADPRMYNDVYISLQNILFNIDDVRSCTGNDVSQFSRKRLTGRLVKVLDYVHYNQ